MFDCIRGRHVKLDNVLSFVFDGIDAATREAESAARLGDRDAAIHKLRQLQAHAEKLIGVIAPAPAEGLRLVVNEPGCRDQLGLER